MPNEIRLSEIRQGTAYTISGFEDVTSNYAEKLHKMGFINGTEVKLAPVKLKDPMVFQIRGSRIALRKRDAGQILVTGGRSCTR